MTALADLDPQAVREAIGALVATHVHPPRIAEIREAVAERALGLPSEVEALRQVEARIAWIRQRREFGHEDDPPPSMHAVVKEALDLVGGAWAFATVEEPSVLRGQLLRLYRSARVEAILSVQIPTALALGPGTRQEAVSGATRAEVGESTG